MMDDRAIEAPLAACSPILRRTNSPHNKTRMADFEQFNADQLAFGSGPGGRTIGCRRWLFTSLPPSLEKSQDHTP
jgi:hypothetical protein